MEKTIGLMQKALNWPEEALASSGGGQWLESYNPAASASGGEAGPPLDDVRFQAFLDNVGVLERMHELRKTVYLVGMEASLRWVSECTLSV